MGLLRDGFLLGGEVADAEEECEVDALDGEEDFLLGTGIGRTIATGLTAVGDCEPWEMWSKETRLFIELYGESRLVSDVGELAGFETSTKLPMDVE